MDKILTEENIGTILESLYNQAVKGIPKVSKPIPELADDYFNKNDYDVEKSAKSMLKYQIAKCTTSGFVTGFGGLITMPVTIPANLSSVLYVQMRMIACTAYMAGYDLDSDQVQTVVYACLAGLAVNNLFKKFGVKFAEKVAVKGIEKIPGKVLVKINQRIGFRLVTKFGEKGLVNIAKAVPVIGAAVNGGFDFVETKAIADRTYKMFIEKDFNVGDIIDD